MARRAPCRAPRPAARAQPQRLALVALELGERGRLLVARVALRLRCRADAAVAPPAVAETAAGAAPLRLVLALLNRRLDVDLTHLLPRHLAARDPRVLVVRRPPVHDAGVAQRVESVLRVLGRGRD
eukprot:52605-Pleurochrysis_carterae.AAC.2